MSFSGSNEKALLVVWLAKRKYKSLLLMNFSIDEDNRFVLSKCMKSLRKLLERISSPTQLHKARRNESSVNRNLSVSKE